MKTLQKRRSAAARGLPSGCKVTIEVDASERVSGVVDQGNLERFAVLELGSPNSLYYSEHL